MITGNLIGRGATAEIYALEDRKALKLFRSNMPKALIEREYNNTRAVAGCGIRAPEATVLVEQDGR